MIIIVLYIRSIERFHDTHEHRTLLQVRSGCQCQCTEGGVLCRKYHKKCDTLRHTEKTCVEVCSTPNQSPVGKNSKGVIKNPPSVILPLQSTVRSHAYCVLGDRVQSLRGFLHKTSLAFSWKITFLYLEVLLSLVMCITK